VRKGNESTSRKTLFNLVGGAAVGFSTKHVVAAAE
jgi:hypothetical protein